MACVCLCTQEDCKVLSHITAHSCVCMKHGVLLLESEHIVLDTNNVHARFGGQWWLDWPQGLQLCPHIGGVYTTAKRASHVHTTSKVCNTAPCHAHTSLPAASHP